MSALDYIAGQSKRLVIAEGLGLVVLLAVLDYFTTWEISLAIFYLIPISFVVWGAGRWPGIVVSTASAVAWLLIDTLCGPPASHPAVPYWNSTMRLGFFLIVTLTLSRLKEALDREKELSSTDPLTGVKNSRAYREGVHAELERAKRYSRPFSVAYLDLDNFKMVNDHFGHSQGDGLLQMVATTIQSNVRKTDLVARLGGDEFALLLPEAGYESAEAVVQKIHQLLLEKLTTAGFPVTCSIGVVTYLRPADSVDELLRRADACMYLAKKTGKNRLEHVVVGAVAEVQQGPHCDLATTGTLRSSVAS